MEPATSSIVIVLAFAAAAAVVGAWALAICERRRLRELVAWIMAQHGPRWEALPPVTRRLNLVGAVELLLRQGLGEDAEFLARYRQVKQGKHWQWVLQAVGAALIGTIFLGVRYFGWVW